MEKMSAGTSSVLAGDNHILIDLASWYKASLAEKIELIHSAIEQGKTIRFHYYAPRGESDRTVEPYYLVFQWASWYVWGWCRGKEDFRLFKLNRMTELAAGEMFEKRRAAYPNLRTERVFPANVQVKAIISGKYKWRLIEEYGAGCYVEQPDGRCLFSFGFTDRDQILTWILSFQGEAELLEPVDLRDELWQIGETLGKTYERT